MAQDLLEQLDEEERREEADRSKPTPGLKLSGSAMIASLFTSANHKPDALCTAQQGGGDNRFCKNDTPLMGNDTPVMVKFTPPRLVLHDGRQDHDADVSGCSPTSVPAFVGCSLVHFALHAPHLFQPRMYPAAAACRETGRRTGDCLLWTPATGALPAAFDRL